MKASISSPIPLLKSYSAFTDYHICKPSLVSNSEYLGFYLDRKAKGDMVILDCTDSYPRVPIRVERLWDSVELLRPSFVVAPDLDMSSTRTVALALDFLGKYGKKLEKLGIQVLGSIQGADLKQCVYCYKALYKLVDGIVLSRSIEASVGRVNFIKRTRSNKPIHIFEVHKDPENEVDSLLDLERDNIVGFSTDLPVRLGLLCRLLQEYKPEPQPLDMFSDYNPFPDWTFKNVEEWIMMVEGE